MRLYVRTEKSTMPVRYTSTATVRLVSTLEPKRTECIPGTTVVAACCAHCQLRTPYLGLLAALTQSANDVFREGEAGINDISSIFSSSSKCALVEHFRLCVGATTFFIAISAARSSFSMLPRAPHSQLFLVKNNIPR